MREFRRFLDSSLRVVRRQVCVRRCRITYAVVLTVAHCDCAIVVHVCGRRMREVAQAENRAPRIGHWVDVASADIYGATLHVRPVAAIALERVRVILGRGRISPGIPLLGGRAVAVGAAQRRRVWRGHIVGILMRFIVRRRWVGFIRYTVYKRMHRVEVSTASCAGGARANGTPGGLSTRRGHHSGTFLILLVFHPAVLKPDFDLSFCEVQKVCHFHSPGSAEIAVKVELLLQFH